MSTWKEEDGALSRQFDFKDFSEALAFLMRVGLLAESQKHHPEIHNVYRKVNLRLSTHDAGNTVTDKDRQLAKSIDALLD